MESTFQDGVGRSWTFACNAFTLHRLKQETGIDLTKSFQEVRDDSGDVVDVLGDVAGDIGKFGITIESLLQDEFSREGTSAREVLSSLRDEKAVESAVEALAMGVLDFFREELRGPLKTAFAKFWRATTKRLDARAKTARTKIEAVTDEEYETMADGVIASLDSSTSGS